MVSVAGVSTTVLTMPVVTVLIVFGRVHDSTLYP